MKAPSPSTTPTTSSSARDIRENEYEQTNEKTGYAYLPTRALRWRQVTRHGYAAEPNGCTYVVGRNPRKDSMGFAYWIASFKNNDDVDNILLGDAFMNRWEAMEVCEAWEYERIKSARDERVSANEQTKLIGEDD